MQRKIKKHLEIRLFLGKTSNHTVYSFIAACVLFNIQWISSVESTFVTTIAVSHHAECWFYVLSSILFNSYFCLLSGIMVMNSKLKQLYEKMFPLYIYKSGFIPCNVFSDITNYLSLQRCEVLENEHKPHHPGAESQSVKSPGWWWLLWWCLSSAGYHFMFLTSSTFLWSFPGTSGGSMFLLLCFPMRTAVPTPYCMDFCLTTSREASERPCAAPRAG